MKHSVQVAILASAFVLAAGCGGARGQAILYAPNPSNVSEPRSLVVALVEANALPGWLVRPELNQLGLSIRFDRIAGIFISHTRYGYMVTVEHADYPLFRWTLNNLEDAQRFADCLESLRASALQ